MRHKPHLVCFLYHRMILVFVLGIDGLDLLADEHLVCFLYHRMILVFVLGIDGLDLLADEIHVVLELLHLTVHLVDEGIALL